MNYDSIVTQPQRMTIQQALALGAQHHQAGRLAEAEAIYRQVLAVQPDHADARQLLGALASQVGQMHARVGRTSEAIVAFQHAVTLSPHAPELRNNLGSALAQAKRFPEAIAAYREAIQIKPDYFDAHFNLGNILRAAGDASGAAEHYLAALRAGPTHARLCNDLGNALYELGFPDDAAAAYRRAMQLDPTLPEPHNGLANIHSQNDQLDSAIDEINRALELRPDFAAAKCNLASVLLNRGDIEAAEKTYREVIALKPDHALAHHNLSLVLALKGDLAGAWPEFEWRDRAPELGKVVAQLPYPRWDGSDLSDKRIFIHAEQGIGDTIQFVRYIPQVVQRGGRILLGVQQELGRLLATFPGIEKLLLRDDVIPADIDVHCPLMSLPGIFHTTLETIPNHVPYLFADPGLGADWRQRLSSDHRKKVGIVFAGSSSHIHDRLRSMPVEMLAPLDELKEICFISLQKGAPAANLRKAPLAMMDWTDELHDFADTAALIDNLDLVISVDTAVAHLAGAMGKPVWLLLQAIPDRRWMLDREDSPWYPSMKLLRQPARGDWASVVRRVVDLLRQEAP
jgi:Flp pilus assembly protein TadD